MKQIRVQGPRDQDYYYRTILPDYYYTVFYLDGVAQICYRTEQMPDVEQLREHYLLNDRF
jgi:hypothetical protein